MHWDYQIGLHFRCGDRSYIDGAAADLGCTHDGTGTNPHAGHHTHTFLQFLPSPVLYDPLSRTLCTEMYHLYCTELVHIAFLIIVSEMKNAYIDAIETH